jgi:nucleotide-binding universal stress UspA family protein
MHQTHDHAMLALPPPPRRSFIALAGEDTSRETSRRYRRLLVASDGSTLSNGALTFAARLARRDNAQIDVVSVVRTASQNDSSATYAEEESRRTAARLDRVAAQGDALLGTAAEWSVMVLAGDPLASLARAASARPYDLVLIGVRRGVTCALGYSTALDLAQRIAVPVLAVPEFFRSLPRRAVVGVDGSFAAFAAARAARQLLELPAAIDLVHVARILAAGYSRERRDADIGRRLALLAREMDETDGLQVRSVLLPERDPVAALLRCAKHARADLLALGNRGSPKATPTAKVARSVLERAEQCVLLSGNVPRLPTTWAPSSDEIAIAGSAPFLA